MKRSARRPSGPHVCADERTCWFTETAEDRAEIDAERTRLDAEEPHDHDDCEECDGRANSEFARGYRRGRRDALASQRAPAVPADAAADSSS